MWTHKTRAQTAGTVLVFFAGLVLYLGTARPDMMWGDSADFALCAHYLGVPHPTGYPLIALLGKLVSYIPVGPLGFRIGLLSSFVAAVLLGVFFRLASALGRSALIGLYATLTLACSTFLWEQAVSVEVYALNLFACLLLLELMLPATRGPIGLAAFFFAGALGLGNHGTLVFPALMLGVIGLVLERRRFPRAFATGGFFVMLGLGLYLCLPLFSARTNLFDWNHPTTAKNFILLLSGLDFWVIGEYKAAAMWETAKALCGSIAAQASVLWISGFLAAFFVRGERLRKVMLLGVFVLTAFFPIMYPTKEKEAFFIISYTVFLLMGVIGLSGIWDRLAAGRARTAAAAVLAAIVLLHAGFLLHRNKDMRLGVYDDSPLVYNRLLLKDARRDAILFIDHVADDTVATPLYYQFAYGARPDVFLFHRLYLAFPWYRDYMRERAWAQGHPAVIPDVDLRAERRKSYLVRREEYARLRAGKTMNTVSIDIQTRKIWDSNSNRVPIYINTPSRFRFSGQSSEVPLELNGFLFSMNGVGSGHAPRPAPDGRVFNALLADYYIERAQWYAAKEMPAAVVSALLNALEYRKDPRIYESLAGAYLALGDTRRSDYYRGLFSHERLKDYDLR